MSTHIAPRRTRRRLVIASIAASAVGLTGIGYATQGASADTAAVTQAATQAVPTELQQPSNGYGGTWGGTFGPPGTTQTTEGQTTQTEAVDATDAQEVGLVYINTTLDYGTGQAAGTGMILTSDGEILTNHHVVEGATTISVEVVSTGQTYTADVVGYDDTHDVAVLQLEGASGLTPVTTDTSGDVQVGDSVVGVGNANGDGGAASAAAGTVTALDQSITVQDEQGSGSSQLTGLIQIDADIISGDSGGALYDDDGEVIGMNTAASSGTADVTGYAVPISQALTIADQIESGTASATVSIGGTAFLGVELSTQVTGALVAGTVDDSATATAGITAGSTITSFGGTSITSGDALSEAVASHAVGDRVTITWTDSSSQAHSATVTLGTGPVG